MLALPLLTWALVASVLLGYGRPRLEALAGGLGIVAAFTVLSTEMLSALHAVTLPGVAGVWAAFIAALVVLGRRRIAAGAARLQVERGARWDTTDRVVAAVIATFLLAAAAGALLYPTTNYDSLTYHMPRVFFWFQDRSVELFPTPEGRQLFSSTLVEYQALTMKVLAGGSERAVGLAQWVAYALTIALVSMNAGRLGASRRGRQVAAVAAAAVPMAALQASTTQNDLTCAAWLLAAVYGMLSFLDRRASDLRVPARRSGWPWALVIGSGLGLAVLSKPTAYLIAAPFVLWFAVRAVRNIGLRRTALLAATALLAFGALTASTYIRTGRALDGDILGLSAPGNTHILVKDRSPSALMVNAVKNSSMQLGTPSAGVNSAISNVLGGALGLIGDVENPRTKEADAGPYQLDPRIINHDIAPAPMTVVLLALALAAAIALRWRDGLADTGGYAAPAAAAWLLLTALVSWNHYVNRVTLPALLLWLPWVGAVASIALDRWRRAAPRLLALVLAAAVAWAGVAVAFSSTNRLVPASALGVTIGARDIGWWNTGYDDLRFRIAAPEYEEAFGAAAGAVRDSGAVSVGLDVRSGDFRVQPLLWLLRDLRVDYVGATVLPGKLPVTATPEVIVLVVPASDSASVPAAPADVLLERMVAADVAITVYRAR